MRYLSGNIHSVHVPVLRGLDGADLKLFAIQLQQRFAHFRFPPAKAGGKFSAESILDFQQIGIGIL